MKVFFRKIHRWLGLLMAVQIIAWMASGMYFAIFPIETIRGEHLTDAPESINSNMLEGLISPSAAWSAFSASLSGQSKLKDLKLSRNMGETWYRVVASSDGKTQTRLVNAQSGEVSGFLGQAEVTQIAAGLLNTPGIIESVELITEHYEGSEFRGRTLPMWRVSFTEPESLNLYIDGWTGELVTRRTTRWRIFDFFWMLHIMDFGDRDDFNTPLLQIAAALGLFVALSGLVFWAMTTSLFRRRKIRS
ncbi:MAG: hypothetical protein ACI934_002283 [Pseudohongiellaceae bacterium]|jgi:hypothetical protein